ncbi:MAG: hypothetical protein MOIL_01079 [Candidatus Methanolliviera sp. GoM_oil]|nr:MAG: hypothetical protein MOIL_01079 [Candidatus Methanolliviera sp. GoM_oil]
MGCAQTKFGMPKTKFLSTTEGIFSAVKRKFGEKTVSRSKNGLIAEAIQRFWNYDLLRAYGMKKVREMQQNQRFCAQQIGDLHVV